LFVYSVTLEPLSGVRSLIVKFCITQFNTHKNIHKWRYATIYKLVKHPITVKCTHTIWHTYANNLGK